MGYWKQQMIKDQLGIETSKQKAVCAECGVLYEIEIDRQDDEPGFRSPSDRIPMKLPCGHAGPEYDREHESLSFHKIR